MILIDYRTQLGHEYGRYLFEFLANQFGPHNVALGVDALIPPNTSPLDAMRQVMPRIAVLVVIVDQHWLDDEWYTNEQDKTSAAIQAGFENRINAVKVLVDDVELPTTSEHPILQRALTMPSLRVSKEDFVEKATRIAEAARQAMRPQQPQLYAPPPAGVPMQTQQPAPPTPYQQYPSYNAQPPAYGYGVNPAAMQPYQASPPYQAAAPYGALPAPPQKRNSSCGGPIVIIAVFAAVMLGVFFLLPPVIDSMFEDTLDDISSSAVSLPPTATRRPPTATPAPILRDSFSVGSGGSTVYADFSSRSSTDYMVIVSGTFIYDSGSFGGQEADARYRISDSGSPEIHSMFEINGSTRRPDVEDPLSNTYRYDLRGNGSRFYFQISDSWTLDNSGSLSVFIYEVP